MKRIQFSITYPERFRHPLHRQVIERAALSRAEILLWSPTAAPTTLCWCDSDRAATEAAVSAIDSLLVRSLVPGTDGTYAFLHQAAYEFADAILDTIHESDVIFVPPVVFLDTGAVRFEAVGESAALSAFHDGLADLGELTIDRVTPFERPDAPAALTDRQFAALETAVSTGYYEVPREGTVAEVAGELDCSTSTAGELLRKAEAAVLRDYVASR